MAHPRSALLATLAVTGVVLALAPGCSGDNNPGVQTALAIKVVPGNGAACPVGGGVAVNVGDPASVTTLGNGASSNGAKVDVQCQVAGDDSAGYNVAANLSVGTLYTFTMNGHFPGASGGTVPTAPGITGGLNVATGGLIASFSDSNCTVTFPNAAGGAQGIAPTRIAGHIDCTMGVDAKRMHTCEFAGDFLFENCGK